jgi:hypothetical protein
MKLQFTDLQQTKLVFQAELIMLQSQLDELKAKVDQTELNCQKLVMCTLLLASFGHFVIHFYRGAWEARHGTCDTSKA